ncbi:tryptophan halogenase family protein [Niveispirillum irakense]|uniref:tryptophan halogenase family protein n=1 Tax=Niveispirillum irakense TaxID=34011 RepID=UPI0003FE68EA|nr:tryptophan halogenase family protein [Niveispirillum irakense]
MKPLRKIVIAGGGTAGWITAAMLSHMLKGAATAVELVESDEIGTIGVGESTIPPFITLLRNLGIDEQDFIRQTCASFKLGIRFRDWLSLDSTYFHPFGAIGGQIDIHEFYQCWLRAKANGHPSSLMDFAPAAAMADAGRFMLPFKAQRTMIGGASYALHVDAKRVATYLRRYAEERGAIRTEGRIDRVRTRPDGAIEALVLRDGREVTGDFFIDCTGFRSLLVGQTLGVGLIDWSDQLLCDRAVAVQTENVGDTHPYTLSEALGHGWRWRIPLQHRAGNGYVYSSRFLSDDEAVATLMAKVQGRALTQPMIIPFKTGMRARMWEKNCLALGLAAGFIEPLESTAIHLVYRAVDYLLRFFPDQDCDPALAAEFNRRMGAEYEEVKDFIVLHYCLTRRDDTPFWQECRRTPIPPSLRARMDLFRASGVLREGLDELFRAVSWQAVYDGMGVRPARYQGMVERMPLSVIKETLDRTPDLLRAQVQGLPSHDDFIRAHCAAEKDF